MIPFNSVGIIGLGNFGAFLQERIKEALGDKVQILGFDTDPKRKGNASFREVAACDLVVPAVPIPAFASTVDRILSAGTFRGTVVDVSSVKLHPLNVLRNLPPDVSWSLWHPLFGPQSFAENENRLKGLPIVMCEDSKHRQAQLSTWFLWSEILKLDIHQMDADEHDRTVSAYQFLTQYFGRCVEEVISGVINEKVQTYSTQLFHQAMRIVGGDEQLFWWVYEYNEYCAQYAELVERKVATMRQKRLAIRVRK